LLKYAIDIHTSYRQTDKLITLLRTRPGGEVVNDAEILCYTPIAHGVLAYEQ